MEYFVKLNTVYLFSHIKLFIHLHHRIIIINDILLFSQLKIFQNY